MGAAGRRRARRPRARRRPARPPRRRQRPLVVARPDPPLAPGPSRRGAHASRPAQRRGDGAAAAPRAGARCSCAAASCGATGRGWSRWSRHWPARASSTRCWRRTTWGAASPACGRTAGAPCGSPRRGRCWRRPAWSAGRAAAARRRPLEVGCAVRGGDDAGRRAPRLRGRPDDRGRRRRARAGPRRGTAAREPRPGAGAAAAPGAGRAPRRPGRSGRRRRLPVPRGRGNRRAARDLRDADARPRLQGRHRRRAAAARARRRRPHAGRRPDRGDRGAGAPRPARGDAARASTRRSAPGRCRRTGAS